MYEIVEFCITTVSTLVIIRMNCGVSSTTSQSSSMSPQDTIIVSVRIRPENSKEHAQGYPLVVQSIDGKMLAFDPKPEQEPFFGPRVANKRVKGRHKHKDLTFAFDNVFGESSTQREVFEATTRKVLPSVLEGINCSIFAYGATGAGKTHTMLGTPEQPGIIYQTMKELYFLIEERQNEITCEIAVTYLEIYNENIYDLLKDGKRCLPLREGSKQSATITGISYTKPKDAQDLLHILSQGNKRRTQHPTDANAQSSRSHAVFQVYVHQKPKAAGTKTEVTMAKLSLIDLAGSERATVSTNCGVRLREGANINRSLLALGNVINALASNKPNKSHVPYRDSKLTRLLKDSLGGNCRTVMIANVSPSGCSFEDTYNTLRYADRAKEIKVKTNRNVVNVKQPIHKYIAIIDDLRLQVNHLQEELRKPRFPALPAQTILRLNGFKSIISQLFQTRLGLNRKQQDAHSERTASLVSSARREEELELLQLLDCRDTKLISQLQCSQERARERETDLQKEMDLLDTALNSNSSDLATKYVELTKEFPNESSCKELFHDISNMAYEISSIKFEKDALYHQTKLQCRSLTQQEAEINQKTELIGNLTTIVSSLYSKLTNIGSASEEDHSAVSGILKAISKQKEVSWADQIQDTPVTRKREIFSRLEYSPLTPNSNRKTLGILCSSSNPFIKSNSETQVTSTLPSSLTLPSTPVPSQTQPQPPPHSKAPLFNNFFEKPLSLFPDTPVRMDLDLYNIPTHTTQHGGTDNQLINSVTNNLCIKPENTELLKTAQSDVTNLTGFIPKFKLNTLDSTFDIEENLNKPKSNKRHFSYISPTLRSSSNKRFASEPCPSSLSSKVSVSLRLSKKLPTYAQLTIAAKSKYRKPITSLTSKN